MPGSPDQTPALARAKADIHLFERSEETGERVLQVDRPLPGLAEIFRTELVLTRYYGGSERPVFMRSLRPCQTGFVIDPKSKPHVFS